MGEKYSNAQNTLNKYRQTPLDCAMSEDKKPAHTHVVKFLGGDITVIDEYNGQMINEDNRIIQAKNGVSTASRSPRSQKKTPTKALSKQRSLKRMVSVIIPTTVHTTGYYDDEDDTSISMDIDSSYFSATPPEN